MYIKFTGNIIKLLRAIYKIQFESVSPEVYYIAKISYFGRIYYILICISLKGLDFKWKLTVKTNYDKGTARLFMVTPANGILKKVTAKIHICNTVGLFFNEM